MIPNTALFPGRVFRPASADPNRMIRKKITVNGIVQGVGFRPFLHRLTKEYSCTGWIRNTSSGVEIELQGEEENLSGLLLKMKTEAPPLAVLEHISEEMTDLKPNETGFEIRKSEKGAENDVLIAPDISVCGECLREMRTPGDRRYRYPFLNCTNCGPRFTIVKDVPYDRARTSMSAFPMCGECLEEYENIENRRYHAQPDCCPVCGPELFFQKGKAGAVGGEKKTESASSDEGIPEFVRGNEAALSAAKQLLRSGGILAVKGLGGFHLACLVTPELLLELRRRKHREEKPFAIMCRDIEAAERLVRLGPEEKKLLLSPRRPIVLAEKREDLPPALAEAISDNRAIGVMLPYTPLHTLLLEEEELSLLVMTSANRSDVPVMYRNEEALKELADIADGFLLHNREIVTRCDDSLYRLLEGKPYPLRRSRGYVPQPVTVPFSSEGILACGAEQKASFVLTKGQYAFPSQHIGDLKNWETFTHYEEQIRHFEKLFGIRVKSLVCDLHPDYLSSEYAGERTKKEGHPLLAVQHHHAHLASCMADNGLSGKVIGLVWDGTGLGEDGRIWGGETFYGGYESVRRLCSIREIRLPGGDAAIREIGRIGFSLKRDAGWEREDASVRDAVWNRKDVSVQDTGGKRNDLSAREKTWERMLSLGVNCPASSGMGRLFDGVCSLLGIRQEVSYEGQGAVLLEAEAEKSSEEKLPLPEPVFTEEDGLIRWDYRPLICFLLKEKEGGREVPLLAAAFHEALLAVALEECRKAREITGEKRVVLSGGVFQNMYLMKRLLPLLRENGFDVYRHVRVACNDEGISLGQAMIAAVRGMDG